MFHFIRNSNKKKTKKIKRNRIGANQRAKMMVLYDGSGNKMSKRTRDYNLIGRLSIAAKHLMLMYTNIISIGKQQQPKRMKSND